MKYNKTPLDYNQQIEMLKKRGLLIADEEEAIHYLRVIDLYTRPNTSNQFIQASTKIIAEIIS